MKLTTKGRFAVTAMLDIAINEALAANSEKKPITLADISERQHISLSYLEQLFSRLRRSGLVTSVRGPGGGYKLAKPAAEISVAHIISAVDELVDATQCGGNQNCHEEGPCMTHELWSNLNIKIMDYLSSVKLSDVVASKIQGQKIDLPQHGLQQPIEIVKRPTAHFA
jgi:Rrf2 family iron-sulfur cluster assembly transcriptional regulator